PEKNQHILTGHRNFLATAVYFLYSYGRENAAREWYAYLKQTYPDAPGTQGKSMEEYAFDRVQEEVGSTDPNRIRAVVEGDLERSYVDTAMGEDDHALVMGTLAKRIYNRYMSAIGDAQKERVGLPPFPEIQKVVMERL